MRGHPVELVAERFQLVAGLDREPQAEIAAADPPRALRQDLDRHGHAPAEPEDTRTAQASRTTRRNVERPIDA